jgi:hypothetical protein
MQRVSVLLNNGGGSFDPYTAYNVDSGPQIVFAADMDGDGDIDLVTPNADDASTSMRLNAGDGSFPAERTFAGGDYPTSVYAADFNGDGALDLAVSNRDDDNVMVLFNQRRVSVTMPIDITHHDIKFVSGADTLAVMNFTFEALDSVDVTVHKGVMPPNTPIGSDWVRRYYTITTVPPGGVFIADVKLYYEQEEFDNSGLSDESDLFLYRYDGPASRWEFQNGVLDTDANSYTCRNVLEFSTWAFTDPMTGVGVMDNESVPSKTVLYQNHPNPFNPTTAIDYGLREPCRVTLTIYNVLGQKVRTLVDGDQTAGFKTARWDGKNTKGQSVASGVYIYRLRAGDFVEAKKMILLR